MIELHIVHSNFKSVLSNPINLEGVINYERRNPLTVKMVRVVSNWVVVMGTFAVSVSGFRLPPAALMRQGCRQGLAAKPPVWSEVLAAGLKSAKRGDASDKNRGLSLNEEVPWLISEQPSEAESSTLYKSDAMTYGTSLCLAEEYMVLNDHLDDAKSLAELAMSTADARKEDDNIFSAYADGVLANVLHLQGEYEEAAKHYRTALNKYERHYASSSGPQAVETVAATQLISWSHMAERDFNSAVHSCTAALSMTRRLLGDDAVDSANAAFNLGTALMNTGHVGEGTESLFKEAIRVYECNAVKEPDEPNMYAVQVANSHEALGHIFFLRGDDKRAEAEWTFVWNMFEDTKLSDAPSVVPSLKNLADIKLRRKDFVGARDLFAAALEALSADPRYGPDHERSVYLRENVLALDASISSN